MTGAQPEDRLPASVGGLIGFAAAAYAERAPLYLALALLAFALDGLVQLLAPDKIPGAIAAQIVGDALAIAAVTLGVATRAAGATGATGKIFEAAVVRWGDVAGATGIAAIFTLYIQRIALFSDGFDTMAFIAAPMAWLLLGALSLAGPVTALTTDRPIVAIVTGFWRAMFLSLRLTNIPRLLLVAAAVAAVDGVELLAYPAMKASGIPHLIFWANVPFDALFIGPLAALQAVFALDFARRLRASAPPAR